MSGVMLTKARRSQWLKILKLYYAAFPKEERKPFSVIYKMARQGKSDVWCVWSGGRFAGFAATINGPELVLLDYFAVESKLRGRGIGTEALKGLMAHYRDYGFFVEIEGTWEDSPEKAAREKRKQFYVNCGLVPMSVRAEVFGVKMELLGCRCTLDFAGYQRFYREQYNPWAAEHILPVFSEK